MLAIAFPDLFTVAQGSQATDTGSSLPPTLLRHCVQPLTQ